MPAVTHILDSIPFELDRDTLMHSARVQPDGEDAAEFMLCGASAVMVGTANIVDPGASVRIVNELDDFLEEQGIQDVNLLIGGLAV